MAVVDPRLAGPDTAAARADLLGLSGLMIDFGTSVAMLRWPNDRARLVAMVGLHTLPVVTS